MLLMTALGLPFEGAYEPRGPAPVLEAAGEAE
jgi:hypothetical protein